jgi:hypothetical protein
MLTQVEQDRIVAEVRQIVRYVKIRDARVRRLEMNEKAAKAAFEKHIDRLRDMLKELG